MREDLRSRERDREPGGSRRRMLLSRRVVVAGRRRAVFIIMFRGWPPYFRKCEKYFGILPRFPTRNHSFLPDDGREIMEGFVFPAGLDRECSLPSCMLEDQRERFDECGLMMTNQPKMVIFE